MLKDNLLVMSNILETITGTSINLHEINIDNSILQEVKVNKNDILVHIGDCSSKIYFVAKGVLRAYYIDLDGNDKTKIFMDEGSACCDDELIVSAPSNVCIEALENCVLLAVSHKDFRDLIERNDTLKDMWIKALEMSLAYKIRRENDFLVKSATERYLDFKLMFPNLENRVSQKYIASYLGITPVSLSRIRRSIREVN